MTDFLNLMVPDDLVKTLLNCFYVVLLIDAMSIIVYNLRTAVRSVSD